MTIGSADISEVCVWVKFEECDNTSWAFKEGSVDTISGFFKCIFFIRVTYLGKVGAYVGTERGSWQ